MKEAALEIFTITLVVAAFTLIIAIAVMPLVFVFHLFGTTVGAIVTVVGVLLSAFFFFTWVHHGDPRE